MNSNLRDIVAQLNASGQNKAGDGKPDAEKQAARRKQPAKPKASKSGSSGGPPPEGGGTAAAGRLKVKLRGTGNTVTPLSKTTTAATIAAQSAATAAPLDPTTAPLLKRVKDVLDCLLKHNGSQLSPVQLQELTGHNLEVDSKLLQELHRHPRMTYHKAPPVPNPAALPPSSPAAWYAYLPEVQGIHDKVSLLNYIRDNKGPALLAEVLGRSYLKAAEDLKELKAEGRIFILGHPDSEKEVVFVRDMLGMDTIQEDVRALWFEVCQEHVRDHVPHGVLELQQAVNKAGLRSALANQPFKRVQPGAPRERAKRPRQQRINIDKATNAHLPFLFAASQPKNIDS